MNFQNFVIAMTSGLLTAPEARLSAAWAQCDLYVESSILQAEEKPSVTIGDGSSARIPLRQWIGLMRAKEICHVRTAIRFHREKFPSHKMAGFSGGRPWKIEVVWQGGAATYQAGTVSSPPYAMTMSILAEIIRSQENPDFYWNNFLDEVNQFHRCNNIAEVTSQELPTFLASPAAAHAWDIIGDTLFQEMQVEAYTYDQSFVIPRHMADLVVPVQSNMDELQEFEPHVWLEVCDDVDVTGKELCRLIEAQPFSNLIWAHCANTERLGTLLGDGYDLDDFPHIKVEDWRAYLSSLNEDEVAVISDVLLKLICIECARRHCKPYIPYDLSDIFGPNELDRRRLHFRERLQSDLGWALLESSTPWQMYVFDKLDTHQSLEHVAHLAQQKQEFDNALASIEDFAGRVQSEFQPAFQLAINLSKQADIERSAGEMRGQQLLTPRPDTSAEQLQKLIDLFIEFEWPASRILGLAAISAADVFGAMGSWNDQSFEGELGEQFDTRSARLFSAMNTYFSALLDIESAV